VRPGTQKVRLSFKCSRVESRWTILFSTTFSTTCQEPVENTTVKVEKCARPVEKSVAHLEI